MRRRRLLTLAGLLLLGACRPAAGPPVPEDSPMPREQPRRANRLAREISPYLRAHAGNPVDWYPWGPEAFRKAQAEDKPVFLSVGYSTCHWCHVMARESFSDPEIAQVLNRYFVSVKVDREERPDVDEIYMNVTQLLTGHGGWPNSVWLTPEGLPFFAGTYFPPTDRPGRPGFKTVLLALAREWRENRDAVLARAREIQRALEKFTATGRLAARLPFGPELVVRAREDLAAHYDPVHGGFGGPPKFPPHAALGLLLFLGENEAETAARRMALATLGAIQAGGIHDHVGGGFHRYATDGRWLRPHFEKMLYDNAQLARLFAEAYRLTGDPVLARTARRTYGWVLREMQDPGGGFYAALDAESEGEEGKFYLWRREEILRLLGPQEGEAFCRLFGVTAAGNYVEEATGRRPGTNVLHLTQPLEAAAREAGMPLAAFLARVDGWLEKLRRARARRVPPHRDDKVLTAWNGLMIGSLARGGALLGEKRYLDAARRAARFLLEGMRTPEGRLRRSYRAGRAHVPGCLPDYVFLAEGLLELRAATGEEAWRDAAAELMQVVETHFGDPVEGGYYFVADDHERLLLRTRDAQDRAVPSGNGVAARVWVRLWRLTGREIYRKRAEGTLRAFRGLMERWPRATETLLHAAALFFAAAPRKEIGPAPDATAALPPLSAAAFLHRTTVAPGTEELLALRLRLAPGWHVTAPEAGAGHLLPLTVTVTGPGVTAGPPVFPPPVSLRQGKTAYAAFTGEVWVRIPLGLAPTAPPGEHTLAVTVTFQACNATRCLRPETLRLTLPYRVAHTPGPVRHEDVFGR